MIVVWEWPESITRRASGAGSGVLWAVRIGPSLG